MASSTPFLAARAGLKAPRSSPYRSIFNSAVQRHASSNIPKPRVLAKPERFNPPSHPSRIRAARPSYGAPLNERERQAQKTRQYPHMMPPEGTFFHWFLTNRTIHLWISMGILFSLTIGVWFEQFVHSTPYADLLPPNSMFFSHPIKFIRRYVEVYDMHLAYVSADVAEKRKQNVDDVKKRSDYRKAHGMDDDKSGIFGGWSAKGDDDALGPALREGGASENSAQAREELDASPVAITATKGVQDAQLERGEFVDFQGQRQKAKAWYQFW
ncbi:hypothetical protein K431DRAFT_221459 [Polychaeton citri CBS 116435]|uniref:Uncharacterized protein n=1 Tax=Polychaeton citri CBS 116435 TaxID=1314669 RepID=A0A9P4QD61_9PEZI|nr:hypothetical protein K431DRAFT_221459 [Polychaeton citri CBS 116435]